MGSVRALYYLQDQSKRGLRYTHYFYGEVDFYETAVPAEWLDELIGELRTIVIPVWSKSDWMTTSMSLQASGFCYRYGKQTVRFSWDQVPDEWAPLEQWVLETSQELDAQFSSPAKEADEK